MTPTTRVRECDVLSPVQHLFRDRFLSAVAESGIVALFRQHRDTPRFLRELDASSRDSIEGITVKACLHFIRTDRSTLSVLLNQWAIHGIRSFLLAAAVPKSDWLEALNDLLHAAHDANDQAYRRWYRSHFSEP